MSGFLGAGPNLSWMCHLEAAESAPVHSDSDNLEDGFESLGENRNWGSGGE